MRKLSIEARYRPAVFAMAAATVVLSCGCAHGSGNINYCLDVRGQGGADVAADVTWRGNEPSKKKIAQIKGEGIQHARHFRVLFGQELPGGAQSGAGSYSLICGVEEGETSNASFYLSPENTAEGQEEPKDPNAPGLTFTRGWSFITFTWPLIWMRNIDAGSIGTTAIARWEGLDLSLYLVRNGKAEPGAGGAIVADDASGLYIHVGFGYDDFELTMPAGKEVARVHFSKRKTDMNLLPQGTTISGSFTWEIEAFDLGPSASDEGDKIVVTSGGSQSEREFLAEVLNRAHEEGIFELPIDAGP